MKLDHTKYPVLMTAGYENKKSISMLFQSATDALVIADLLAQNGFRCIASNYMTEKVSFMVMPLDGEKG